MLAVQHREVAVGVCRVHGDAVTGITRSEGYGGVEGAQKVPSGSA